MTNVSLGLLEDVDEMLNICEIYSIIKYKVDEKITVTLEFIP